MVCICLSLSSVSQGLARNLEYACSRRSRVSATSSPVYLRLHATHMATKRTIKELDAYRKDPSAAVSSLAPVNDDDLRTLRAVLTGPAGTAYEGGRWTLSITIPQTYPNEPPTLTFVTPCCHPNVSFANGEICLDLLKSTWTPAYGLVSTLEAIHQLLSAGAEPDSPLNMDIAKLYREGDTVGAEGLIRFYTGLYATGR
nr:ubiquitin-conjugating enzyme e2 16 [Quercus suber]